MLVLQRYSHCNCKLWRRKGRIEMRVSVLNLSYLAIGTSEEQDVCSAAPDEDYRVDVEVGDGAAWRQFFKITESTERKRWTWVPAGATPPARCA